MRLLLFSNSTSHGRGYLDHALSALDEFLGPVRRLVFIPYAGGDVAAYSAKAAGRLAKAGLSVTGLPVDPWAATMIEEAEAVFVGGGNTFRLLLRLQETGVLDVLRRRVENGMPYVGASAGINVAGPTIRTTNDMPIVEPHGFAALGFVPFQINPHYVDADPRSTHMGETREERLREFLEENERPVLGLREGAWLRREEGSLRLLGENGARLFQRGAPPVELPPGAELDRLFG